MAAISNSPFFRLPRELRDEIYSDLSKNVILRKDTFNLPYLGVGVLSGWASTSVLLVNKQFMVEYIDKLVSQEKEDPRCLVTTFGSIEIQTDTDEQAHSAVENDWQYTLETGPMRAILPSVRTLKIILGGQHNCKIPP